MQKVLLTGASGFIGKNLIFNLGNRFQFYKLERGEKVKRINDFSAIIHLAGLAHDLKNSNKPEDYYNINTNLSKKVFDDFIISNATVFITLSSVKAIADSVTGILSEDCIPSPVTDYGKSKLLSEQYILSKKIPRGKRYYILRPCMVHGAGNKGNLNLLFQFVSKRIPWPLGAFDNKRSFCSIDNLTFVISELLERDDIPSGVYNIADDEPLSTNEIIHLISISLSKNFRIWNLPKYFIKGLAKIGDYIKFPLNTERLNKLTESYIVSNAKIKNAINKSLPISSKDGFIKTIKSFNKNAE